MELEKIIEMLGEDGTNEEKAQKLLDLHKTSTEANERTKVAVIGEKKKLQELLDKLKSDGDTEKEAAETRIKELEELVSKNSPEEVKKEQEAQIKRLNEKFEDERKKWAKELGGAKEAHSMLLNRWTKDQMGLALEDAMTKAGIAGEGSRNNAKKAFLYDYGNSFILRDDNSITNEDHHTVSEVFSKLISADPSYQEFIPSKNSGGGATGTGSGSPAGKKVSRDKYEQMSAQERNTFFTDGGTIG